MSQKERQRLVVLDRVVKSELRLVDAAVALGISYRHCQRLVIGFRDNGEASLIHGLRGRAGTRRTDQESKSNIIEAYRARYPDFGPTLASEKLAERDNLLVQPETLRLWLIDSGDWLVRKRKSHHRSQRKRRPCFGELIQVDGSHHAWFEGRGAKCCLMTMVDDATGRAHLWFAQDEGTFAVMAALRGWVELYGIPQALYTDRLKTYLTEREPTVDEQLAGKDPMSQVGRACEALGIRIIAARSAQAKGRVERKHRLTQDRLIKEMRLAGISTVDDANKFVEKWLPPINDRFSVLPSDAADIHAPVPAGLKLDEVFCRHIERTVANDWTIRYMGQYLQIHKQPDLPPPRSIVFVHHWEDGPLKVWYKGRYLESATLPSMPERAKPEPKTEKKSTGHKPSAEHPWRSGNRPKCDTNPRKQTVEETAAYYMAQPKEVNNAQPGAGT